MLRKCLILLVFCCAFLGAKDPDVLYLTWVSDPATTMVISWHTDKGEGETALLLQQKGEANWRPVAGNAHEVTGTETWVRKVQLEGLAPNTEYLFRIGEEMEVYRFKTLPRGGKEQVHFVVGGDAYQLGSLFHEMNVAIAKKNPDFVVIGGDIAYTIENRITRGKWWEIDRWQKFFVEWKKTMRTKDGCLIPMVPLVGNHDVPHGLVDPAKSPLMFYELFAFPMAGKAYRTLDVNRYLRLILLDTNHTWPVKGEQSEWLKSALSAKSAWKIPVYHVAAYPSYYSENADTTKKIRKWWVPLFEQNGVQLVFEHHNHCYKRTFPLKEGKVDDKGIVYFGDGSWGVPPRKYKKNIPYIAHAESINGCYSVTVSQSTCTVASFTSSGTPIEPPVTFSLR